MKPIVKEFHDDMQVVEEVKAQVARGIPHDHLYVISHDDDRTNRVADNANANTIGLEEEGLATALKNIFRKKGDELRAKFSELGFSDMEAEELEKKLDDGKILLLVKEINTY